MRNLSFIISFFFTIGVKAQTTLLKSPTDTLLPSKSRLTHHAVLKKNDSVNYRLVKMNALVKVSPDGKGTFIRLKSKLTNNNIAYIRAIKNYLQNIIFNKADHNSYVTLEFTFNAK